MNSKTQNSKKGIIIAAIMCLGIFCPNYAQYIFSATGTRFLESISIAPDRMGTVMSSIMTGSLIPGVFLSLVSGLFVDKFGARKTLLAGFFITAAGAVMRIWADNYPFMLACVILIGVNATIINSNSAKIFGMWFNPEKNGLLVGIMMAVGNAAMAAGLGTGALYPSFSAAFIVSGAIAAAAFVLWFLLGKGSKQDGGLQDKSGSPPVSECLKASLKSKGVWITAVSLMLLCTSSVSISMFLPTALSSSRGLSEVSAGAVGMANTIGATVSCAVIPLIFSKLKKVKPCMITFGIIGALGIMFAWRAPEGFPLVFALFLTGFFSVGLSPLLMSIPISLPEIGPKYAGTAGGLMATVQLIGGVVIPTYIITPISGVNYNLLFILFGITMLLFCFFAIFLPGRSER